MSPKNQLPRFEETAFQPELLLVWGSIFLLLVVFIVNFLYLPLPLIFINNGLLIVAGLIIFLQALKSRLPGPKIDIKQRGLQSIVSNLEDALIVYDQDFRVLFFNSTAENLFGLKAAAVLGQRLEASKAEKKEWRLLVQVVFPSLAPTMIPRSPAGAYPQVVDLSFEQPALELRVVTSPVKDAEGQPLGFMKLIHNRTREILLLKSKDEFITVASHQLRAPITDIRWGLETLSQDQSLTQASREIVKTALVASQLLTKTVEDLLNIAKIEEGRFGYQFAPADIVDFLNQALSQATTQARRLGIKIYLESPPAASLPQVLIDAQKLSQAVFNLLDNAVRYNVKNGEVAVKIEALKDKPFLQISVRDTGIGIPAEEINKLFSKFFRATNALKFQTEGSGLGLYIAKNIVQAHGGQMWAESELNRGSTFYFTLPTDTRLVPQAEAPLEY